MLQIDAIPTTATREQTARQFTAPQLRSARLALSALLAAISGCSDDPVSLGTAVAIDRSALSSYSAVWEGYVEAYTFESGSDRVQLVLDENGRGSLTLGEGTPLPLPTDPEEPFPDLELGEIQRLLDHAHNEGFAYEIREALVEDERLRARTGPTNVYEAALCALQTPIDRGDVAQGEPRYTCNEFDGYFVVEGRCYVSDLDVPFEEQPLDHEISCAHWDLCTRCLCEADGCFSSLDDGPFLIDGVLDASGMKLEGSFATGLGPRVVRLTRQP